jgi:hypothetical protein
MIPALIVLSLLSLLVATEPEQAAPPEQPSPEPPLRPARKGVAAQAPESDRIAA